MSADGDRPGREVAHRLFAAEYDDATLSHAESDRERAPNYVITPTGARVNRLFVVGTVTEVTSVNEDMVRARVVDPTGAFVVYAGQYQPDELAALEALEPPAFVAITGKARTFQPDDSDQVYTSVRPESVATVDVDTRDRWVIDAADRTVDRIETYAAAAELDARDEALTEALLAAGVDEGLANGIPLAQSHYGTTPGYLSALRELSVDAVEVVADERDQVDAFDRRPDESGPSDAAFADLAGDVDLPSVEAASADAPEAETASPAAATGSGTAAVTGTAQGSATSDTVESGDSIDEPDGAFAESETPDDSESSDESEPVDEPETPHEPAAAADESPADESATTTDASTADTGSPGADSEEAAPDPDATGADDESIEPEAGDGASIEPGVDGEETASESVSLDESTDSDDLGDFDAGDEMYEMDDEEREQIESEFGAEFSTGAEVDDPGEADIDVPDEPIEGNGEQGGTAGTEPDDVEAAESDAVEATETEPDTAEEATEEDEDPAEEDEESTGDAGEPAEDVDVQDLVVETMTELDDGDGADRDAVVERVVEAAGVSEAEVEDAIQDALMGGQCYEPDDGTLKAI